MTNAHVTDGRPGAGRAPASYRAEEIREIASALFLSKGYSATTMSDISEAAGILPGSLYHHFDSKESIAVEIVEAFNEAMSDLASSFRGSTYDALEPEARLRELTYASMAQCHQHASALRLRAFEAPTVATDRMRKAIRHRPRALLKVWRETAEALRETVGDFDAALLTFALQRAIVSTVTSTHPLRADPRREAQIYCDALLRGILVECPDDTVLDSSEPMRAAREAVAGWRAVHDGEDVRSHIIAAARTEFARRGYDATTIRDISEASGVRMGTLYRRVSSKEEILAEIVDGYEQHLDGAIRAALTTSPDQCAESLDALAFVLVNASRRFHDEAEILKLGWRRNDTGQAAFQTFAKRTNARLDLFAGVLARGQRSGSVREIASAEELAPHLRTILWLPFERHDRSSVRRAHDFLRTNLLRGVVG